VVPNYSWGGECDFARPDPEGYEIFAGVEEIITVV
jgi:hypothetical protein